LGFQDLRGSIAKVAAFLQKSPTDEQLTRLTEHLRFDNFKKNDAVNNEMPKQLGFMNKDGNFCRKGPLRSSYRLSMSRSK